MERRECATVVTMEPPVALGACTTDRIASNHTDSPDSENVSTVMAELQAYDRDLSACDWSAFAVMEWEWTEAFTPLRHAGPGRITFLAFASEPEL